MHIFAPKSHIFAHLDIWIFYIYKVQKNEFYFSIYNKFKKLKKMGYIYIRCFQHYDDVCKMGKTHNIPERDSQYATSETKRGYFESVFEVEKMGSIERLLQYEFREFNVKYDAGIEFYTKRISALIEPYLIKVGIPYKKLSEDEINQLTRCKREASTVKYQVGINVCKYIKVKLLRLVIFHL